MGSFHWEWEVFLRDTGGGTTYLQWMMSAWGWTLAVSACSWVFALVFGALIGTLRTVPATALRGIGTAWVELFRNIPLLVQIFLWYHVIPAIFTSLRDLPAFVLVVLALGCFTSARVAEQVRAGIQSLPRGQKNAGLAVGLTLPQTYRYVLLPMAFRIIIPPLTSEAMNLIKNSSIALTIGLAELTFRAREMGEYTFHFFEAFTVATLTYVTIAMSANRAMAWIERKVAVPGYIAVRK